MYTNNETNYAELPFLKKNILYIIKKVMRRYDYS